MHITACMQEKKVLQDEQLGFRTEHNSIQQVARISTHVIDHLNFRPRPQTTAVVLFDVEKAFDRVWTQRLIHKLIKHKFPPPIIRAVQSYLQGRSFQVKLKDALCKTRHTSWCSTVLGPILFNLYISDFPRTQSTNIALYAHDAAIYASDQEPRAAFSKVQMHIPVIETYMRKWHITLNAAKTETMVFTKRTNAHIRGCDHPLVVRGNAIQRSDSLRYLGVKLDTSMTFSQHIKHNIGCTTGALIALYRVLINKNTPTENKLLIYKALLRPRLIYGAALIPQVAQVCIH